MGEFEIDFGAAAGWADQIEGYSDILKQKKGQAECAARQLRSIGNYRGVESALSKIADNLDKQRRQMKQYGGMLQNIIKAYKDTETAIVDSASPVKRVEKALDGIQDLETDLFSKFGVIGSTAVSVTDLIKAWASGEIEGKDALKLVKSLISNGGRVAGTLGTEKNKRDWIKCLTGMSSDTMADKLDISPDAKIGVQWEAYAKDKISDYSFSKAKGVGKKVQVGAKHAASFLSFIMRGMDNIEEQGGVLTGRAVEETVVETAVDWAGDFAIGSLVALALGPGAPVIAVSLATVGVAWAVDTIVESITGEKTVELISDAICDTAEKVGNAVAEWGKSTWDTMTRFFSGGNQKAAYAGGGGAW